MLRSISRRGVNFFSLGSKIRAAAYSKKPPPLDNENDKDFWSTEPDEENPIERTLRQMGKEMRQIKQKVFFWKKEAVKDEWLPDSTVFPYHVDVVIVGGGAIGSSAAYWVKKIAGEGLSVLVLEKDPTYSKASTVLSVGGVRQQFSMIENIEMSLYGAEFIRNADEHLSIRGEPRVDLQFHPHGYLFLASEEGAETLTQNSKLQQQLGARNKLMTAKQLKEMFPWMNTDGIALGCLGLEKEGWFDPWILLYHLKRKAISLGVDYRKAECKGFHFHNDSDLIIDGGGPETFTGVNHMLVKTADGEKKSLEFAICIVAAGSESAKVARMTKIGNGRGVLTVPLPVEPRKRYVYCFHAPDGPTLDTPMVIDPSGCYFRRDGIANNYIVGRSPCGLEEEPSTDNLDVDEDYFYQKIWPAIAHRTPSFENLKLKSSWAGFYDYNYFDENGIVGQHPMHTNIILATGFSGHGIQQAPAVGRAVMELILHSQYRTIDLTRLGFERFITREPMREKNII